MNHIFVRIKDLLYIEVGGGHDFDSFFKSFLNSICLFIERVMKDREDVTDLAQDVFLKVFERWKEFETEENAKAFYVYIGP
jgi:sigma-70 region 2